jgi:MerR family mercuric resistance operon transcriptional regulator
METYSIGQLARAAGVPTSTIRFYEREGLLKPDARSGANYRLYTQRSRERLEFIRSAQAVGLSLRDVQQMLHVANDSREPCRAVVRLAEERLTEVRRTLRHLRTVEKILSKAVRNCCSDDDGLCNKVAHLKKICASA